MHGSDSDLVWTPRGYALCVAATPCVQRTLCFDALSMGQVNRARNTQVSAAGKGLNVGLMISALGGPAKVFGFIGGSSGDFVAEYLAAQGTPAFWIKLSEPTRSCHTLIEPHTGMVTELVEEAPLPSLLEWEQLEYAVQKGLSEAACLSISGALPPGAPEGFYKKMCIEASRLGLPVLVDSQGRALLEVLATQPWLVKCTSEELAATLGADCSTQEGVERGAAHLLQQGARWALITRGAQSGLLMGPGHVQWVPVQQVAAVNPIGCGDAVTAGLITQLMDGASPQVAVVEAMRIGTIKAGLMLPADLRNHTA